MPPSTRLAWVAAVAVLLAFVHAAQGETAQPQAGQTGTDFVSQDIQTAIESKQSYLDTKEAVRSRQYVHRTILSTVIKATSRFATNRFYLNHMVGFTSVFQLSPGAKYSTASQGVSAGYVTNGGHGFEVGGEFSAISNLYAGYRYFMRPENFALWPMFGFGVGYEVPALSIAGRHPSADPTITAPILGYGTIALLVPLVDVGLRAEVRVSVQGFKRIVLTQGIGAILFL